MVREAETNLRTKLTVSLTTNEKKLQAPKREDKQTPHQAPQTWETFTGSMNLQNI